MSWRYLGETFDIHGGGSDLIFPHHENEAAQSLCAFPGSGFARFWLHNGMLTVDGEKMSKSLGNFTTVETLLEKWPGEVVRMLLLRAHYRASLNFSDAALQESRKELDRFYRALERTPPPSYAAPDVSVMAALCDDLNTPMAFAAMHALADRAMAGDAEASGALHKAGEILGLLQADPGTWFRGSDDSAWIEQAIAERIAARQSRDFARADSIRKELSARGILLEDSATGTIWRKA